MGLLRKRLIATSLLVVVAFVPRSWAEERRCCSSDVCCCVTRLRSNTWHIAESRNFRIHHRGADDVSTKMVKLLEESRDQLRRRWLDQRDRTEWSPKCDVFLYPSAASFRQLTGRSAEMWGFADLEIGDGKVWMRRLDFRADDAERLHRIALHELAHVVLADRFCSRRIPRWADEGIAVLSEPRERQQSLRTWLANEVSLGRQMPLRTLLSAADYPTDQRQIELMYAQSGAWLEFLLTERKYTEREVMQFVATAQTQPASEAVRTCFPNESFEQLEGAWTTWLRAPQTAVATNRD